MTEGGSPDFLPLVVILVGLELEEAEMKMAEVLAQNEKD